MRILVLLVGVCLLPFLFQASLRPVWFAWFLWGMLLLADVGAIWMHWDIQRRLRKLDGPGDDARLVR
jgi:hypothetical protein